MYSKRHRKNEHDKGQKTTGMLLPLLNSFLYIHRPIMVKVSALPLLDVNTTQKIRMFRERCRTNNQFRKLDRFTQCAFEQAHGRKDYSFALYLLLEKTCTSRYYQDMGESLARFGKMNQYANKFNIIDPFLQLQICNVYLYYCMWNNDLPGCLKVIEEMADIIRVSRGGLEMFMFAYPSGRFFLSLLKLDLQECPEKIQQITTAIKNMFDNNNNSLSKMINIFVES